MVLNCTAPGALVKLKNQPGFKLGKCTEPYNSDIHRPDILQPQENEVHGKKCWECSRQNRRGKRAKTPGGKWMREKDYFKPNSRGETPFEERDRKRMTPDHQPPLNRAWDLGGCNMQPSPDAFKKMMQKAEMVRAHCRAHSCSQGTKVKKASAAARSKI